MDDSALPPGRLFCFGLGYSARALAGELAAEGWSVAGTCQTAERRAELAAAGFAMFLLDRGRPLDDDGRAALARATHVLSSVPPDAAGDAVLDQHARDIAAAPGLAWVGYLSTVGVYGDAGGTVVDEDFPRRPTSERGRRRVAAEDAWLALWRERRVPVHLFRLAGIYGPGRSALDDARAGTARRIDKPGHLFSRVHVADIANVLRASMARPNPGAAYNVCDDVPAAPADVAACACALLGLAPPPLVPFAEAARTMSPMALSFWRDNRRVSNRRLHDELGVVLRHPDYRSGLRATLAQGG
jgi:nucleoside-diphosphate-sugar epimerase